MTRNKPLIFKLGVASLSLFAAVLVYSFTRIYPPELLVSIQATHPGLSAQTGIFGSAPSFFYILALGLFIGACASTVTSARVHCLVWVGLALCLELSQYPSIAKPISTCLFNVSSESIWGFVGPYWSRGAFDPLDLLATLIGGSIALILLGHLPKENTDADIF